MDSDESIGSIRIALMMRIAAPRAHAKFRAFASMRGGRRTARSFLLRVKCEKALQ
jgi:hypothetical protein